MLNDWFSSYCFKLLIWSSKFLRTSSAYLSRTSWASCCSLVFSVIKVFTSLKAFFISLISYASARLEPLLVPALVSTISLRVANVFWVDILKFERSCAVAFCIFSMSVSSVLARDTSLESGEVLYERVNGFKIFGQSLKVESNQGFSVKALRALSWPSQEILTLEIWIGPKSTKRLMYLNENAGNLSAVWKRQRIKTKR